ncbi:hypothetical protein ABBQ38_000147 [Trebouxia sp. C0009 RCD-2024]
MSVEVLQAFEKPLLHSSVLQQQHHLCQLASSQAADMIGSLPIDLGSWQQQPQQQQHSGSQLPSSHDDSQALENRKLVILGLPWDTDEETLQQYFSQFGALEEAVIMKDRSTGKSRGFGFVTFLHHSDAQHVAVTDHQVDGRRCEAKFALQRGGGTPNRTTRIFVARIPSAVSDQQFRSYFEQFGIVQDAYMPKDAFKQGHRGIGFVTYASVEPVEHVMASTHTLNGQELAIDRATPKEKPGSGQAQSSKRITLQQLASTLSPTHSLSHSGYSSNGTPFGGPYDPVSSVSMAQHSSPHIVRDANSPTSSNATTSHGVIGGPYNAPGLPADFFKSLQGLAGLDVHGNGSSSAVLQALQGLPGYGGSENGIGIGLGLQQLAQARAQAQFSAQQCALASGYLPGNAVAMQHGYQAGNSSGSKQHDMSRAGLTSGHPSGFQAPSSPSDSMPRSPTAMALQARGHLVSTNASASTQNSSARDAGPRIFVGKLVRGTTETDVREYFSKFGYVMDVYMPRDRMNRAEHRGFGFVTFETEAAILRVASYGGHMIRGSVVAIDSAVPRHDQDGNRIMGDELSMLRRHSINPALDPAIVLELGPDRHHATERMRPGYRPY